MLRLAEVRNWPRRCRPVGPEGLPHHGEVCIGLQFSFLPVGCALSRVGYRIGREHLVFRPAALDTWW
jgi:hypothetical protein